MLFRSALYKRIAAAADDASLEELTAELVDRFGELPPQTQNLLRNARLRLIARRLGIRRLDFGVHGGHVLFEAENQIDPKAVIRRLAGQARFFLACEMSMGQMVEDVQLSVEGLRPVYFYGRSGGNVPTPVCDTAFTARATVAGNRLTGTYTGTDSCEGTYTDGVRVFLGITGASGAPYAALLLRSLADAQVREVVASEPVDVLLTADRAGFLERVRRGIADAADHLDLGVQVVAAPAARTTTARTTTTTVNAPITINGAADPSATAREAARQLRERERAAHDAAHPVREED